MTRDNITIRICIDDSPGDTLRWPLARTPRAQRKRRPPKPTHSRCPCGLTRTHPWPTHPQMHALLPLQLRRRRYQRAPQREWLCLLSRKCWQQKQVGWWWCAYVCACVRTCVCWVCVWSVWSVMNAMRADAWPRDCITYFTREWARDKGRETEIQRNTWAHCGSSAAYLLTLLLQSHSCASHAML